MRGRIWEGGRERLVARWLWSSARRGSEEKKERTKLTFRSFPRDHHHLLPSFLSDPSLCTLKTSPTRSPPAFRHLFDLYCLPCFQVFNRATSPILVSESFLELSIPLLHRSIAIQKSSEFPLFFAPRVGLLNIEVQLGKRSLGRAALLRRRRYFTSS